MKNKPVNEMKLELEAKSTNEGFARYAVSIGNLYRMLHQLLEFVK